MTSDENAHPESRLVALVSGAARGIGRSIVEALNAAGVATVAADIIDPETWPSDHPADLRLKLDVRSEASCEAAMEKVRAVFGRLDYLVNSAGIMRRSPAEVMKLEDFEQVIDVNLTGAFRMCKSAFKLLEVRGGSIVNIASTNALIPATDKAAYCASKAGLAHLTRTLALEWASRGIRVNAVAPGLVATEINADARNDPEWLAARLASIPLGRPVTTDEVAAAVTHLLGKSAAMTTGHVLSVDGGSTL